MNASNRRENERLNLTLFLNEYVDDERHRAVATNISSTGIYMSRVYSYGLRRLQFGREDRSVQLEFTLPNTNETIWARGEICYDDLGLVHSTGVQLVDIARAQREFIADYIRETHKQRWVELLGRVQNQRIPSYS